MIKKKELKIREGRTGNPQHEQQGKKEEDTKRSVINEKQPLLEPIESEAVAVAVNHDQEEGRKPQQQ